MRELRVIFDTNIYGLLIEETLMDLLPEKIHKDTSFLVYGFGPIRKELRNVPKKQKLGRLNKRNLVLTVYDKITKGRNLRPSVESVSLAKKYFEAYKAFKGVHGWTKMEMDFTIVACATLNRMDIVYSDDTSTLSSMPAKKAYGKVNPKETLRTPTFWRYRELKERYRD